MKRKSETETAKNSSRSSWCLNLWKSTWCLLVCILEGLWCCGPVSPPGGLYQRAQLHIWNPKQEIWWPGNCGLEGLLCLWSMELSFLISEDDRWLLFLIYPRDSVNLRPEKPNIQLPLPQSRLSVLRFEGNGLQMSAGSQVVFFLSNWKRRGAGSDRWGWFSFAASSCRSSSLASVFPRTKNKKNSERERRCDAERFHPSSSSSLSETQLLLFFCCTTQGDGEELRFRINSSWCRLQEAAGGGEDGKEEEWKGVGNELMSKFLGCFIEMIWSSPSAEAVELQLSSGPNWTQPSCFWTEPVSCPDASRTVRFLIR